MFDRISIGYIGRGRKSETVYGRTTWKTCYGVFSELNIYINPYHPANKTDNVKHWSNFISAESIHMLLDYNGEFKASSGIDKLLLHSFTPQEMAYYSSGLNESRIS